MAATGLVAWFYLWADSLIVGIYLGSHELGLYRTGNAFVMMIFGFLFGPLLPVLYSYFSGIQHDREQIKRVLLKVVRVISLISIPMGVLLYLSSQVIADFVFGEKWPGVGVAIGVLALTHSLAWLVGVNGEVYRVIGRPNLETWMMGICFIFYVPAYLISAQISFEAFLWTRLLVVFPALIIHWMFLRRNNLNPSLKALKTVLEYSLSLSFLIVVAELLKLYYQAAAIPYIYVVAYSLFSFGCTVALMWIFMRPTIIELAANFQLIQAKTAS